MVHLIRVLFVKGEIRRMELKIITYPLTICKVKSIADIDLSREFFFIGRTEEELSLVCITDDTPEKTLERDDGWRGFRIQGILDFSLIGILSKLSGILAGKQDRYICCFHIQHRLYSCKRGELRESSCCS